MIEALAALTMEGDLESLVSTCSKKDITSFVGAFGSLGEIETLRRNEKCKYLGRNMLGVRKFDDWIHALEIGNIMHLNSLTTTELMWNNNTNS